MNSTIKELQLQSDLHELLSKVAESIGQTVFYDPEADGPYILSMEISLVMIELLERQPHDYQITVCEIVAYFAKLLEHNCVIKSRTGYDGNDDTTENFVAVGFIEDALNENVYRSITHLDVLKTLTPEMIQLSESTLQIYYDDERARELMAAALDA